MAEPTESQVNFVRDIEAGIKALKSQRVVPTKIKISQVTDAAGREPQELSQYVSKLAIQNSWGLIDRLAEAFKSVNMSPLCIERALETRPITLPASLPAKIDPAPLVLKAEMPVEKPIPQAPRAEFANPVGVRPEELLSTVISLISKHPHHAERQKVAGMAAMWFGVGG